MLIQNAWESIANAMYDNFREMTEHSREEILKELHTRWKSTRDYYIKMSNKQETSGSSPAKRAKIPYEEQLTFLQPSRQLRRTSGNYQVETPAEEAMDVLQEDITPRTSGTTTPVPETSTESDGRERNPQDPDPSQAPPSQETPDPSQATTSLDTNPPSSQSTQRRPLRIRDKQLEVEEQALSLIRRVDGNDDCDYISYTLATHCHKIPNNVNRQDFMSYCFVAATVFASVEPLPPVEDLIKDLKIKVGQRSLSPHGVHVSTQTKPHHFPTHTTRPNHFISLFSLVCVHFYVRAIIVTDIVVEDTRGFDDCINCGLIQLHCTGEDPSLTTHDPEGALHEASCPAQPCVENPLSGIQSPLWVWAQQVSHQRKSLIRYQDEGDWMRGTRKRYWWRQSHLILQNLPPKFRCPQHP
ncbi:uncharacterized protein LOC130361084 [Hyla sarda]|uniref:uncharacterized protein LOC130361084 n=1 Tax=Hyla sarda TaxID=327740 RepID=UPI0024C43D26|nr:uncharacterized protein LOC130361084 [Hyla sarda]